MPQMPDVLEGKGYRFSGRPLHQNPRLGSAEVRRAPSSSAPGIGWAGQANTTPLGSREVPVGQQGF